MSNPSANEGNAYSQPHRTAARLGETLCKMSNHLANNLTPADLNEIGRAIHQAGFALEGESLSSAIKNEDINHILARINLVDAKANALLVATDYLCHLAQDLLRQTHELRDQVEGIDDTDY